MSVFLVVASWCLVNEKVAENRPRVAGHFHLQENSLVKKITTNGILDFANQDIQISGGQSFPLTSAYHEFPFNIHIVFWRSGFPFNINKTVCLFFCISEVEAETQAESSDLAKCVRSFWPVASTHVLFSRLGIGPDVLYVYIYIS